MLEVLKIDKKSIASKLRLKKGDKLISYNGKDVVDILDYYYMESLEDISIIVERHGKKVKLEIEKYESEPIGITFTEEIITRTCHNKCKFCFVDQLPKGMRETLYCKDDDYRLSFISGNYVTLTNDKDSDIDRIIDLHLSPIYVSVHATDPIVRVDLLRNRFAGKLMEQLKKLTENGIGVHTQIVLCDGINDGEILQKTMKELYEMYPMVASLAVVPVGLTKHREGLDVLKYATPEFAKRSIKMVEEFSAKCIEEVGDPFVRCSDEFYSLCRMDMPSYESYGDFSQIENGVGIVRKFQTEFYEAFECNKDKKFEKNKTALITGTSFYPYLKKMIEDIKCPYEVFPIENKFFGESVTVTGLLTGQDIINAVKGKEFERIILPKTVLREFGDVFLDDISLAQMKEVLKMEIVITDIGGESFFNAL